MRQFIIFLIDQVEHDFSYFHSSSGRYCRNTDSDYRRSCPYPVKRTTPCPVDKLQISGNIVQDAESRLKCSGDAFSDCHSFFPVSHYKSDLFFPEPFVNASVIFIQETIDIFQLEIGHNMHIHPGMNKIPDDDGITMKIDFVPVCPSKEKNA